MKRRVRSTCLYNDLKKAEQTGGKRSDRVHKSGGTEEPYKGPPLSDVPLFDDAE